MDFYIDFLALLKDISINGAEYHILLPASHLLPQIPAKSTPRPFSPVVCYVFIALPYVCGTVSSMLSGLETRSLGLNTLGKT